MTNSTQTMGQWDEIDSTYWWKGFYLPSQKRLFFKGYSKKYGHNEAYDKEYLLIKKALMLDQHNYLDKTSKIEIHKRIGHECKADDPIILTLFPESFLLGDEILTNRNIYHHLKALYDRRKGKKDPAKYYGPKPETINPSLDKEVTAAIERPYHNLDQVYETIQALERKGVPNGQFSDAFRKILERNPKLK